MVRIIENWMLILGFTNLVLFVIGLILFVPRKVYEKNISDFCNILQSHFHCLIIIFCVVAFHLIEMNIIDQYVTNWVGIDFANGIHAIEGDIVLWFSQNWVPALVYFFVVIYIIIYPFALWFSLLYFIIANEKRAMKTLAYGLLLTYVIALPFYLFMPVTNVYTFYGTESALNTVIPTVEHFFYTTTTTQNNCFPSLHVAVTLFIARSVSLTGNKNIYF